MRFYAGKILELTGIGMLAFGLLEGILNEQHGMRNEYALLALGSVVFYVGWMIEGGKSRE